MLCSFCPRTTRVTSLEFCRNRLESSADRVYRARESRDQTLKKIRSLLRGPNWGLFLSWNSCVYGILGRDFFNHFSETGRIRFRRVRFQTPNSVSFSGLTEFRGANSVSSSRPIICVPKRTHRVFSQNSPSLPQNSVSSLLRNSTLETVFRPFPNFQSPEWP